MGFPSLEGLLLRLVIVLPALLLAIVLHEVAHAYVAYLLGDDTAKRAGRLTLSPLPHLDPVGTLMMILSTIYGRGLGWAKPVPVNPLRFRHPRRDEILVSLAGVTMNALQAVAWAGLARLAFSSVTSGSLAEAAVVFCVSATATNLVLMVFNLLPVPPLDGSHVLFNALNLRDPVLYYRFAQIGPMLLLLLLFTGLLGPVFDATVYPLLRLLLPAGMLY